MKIQTEDYCIVWDGQTLWPNRTKSMSQVEPRCHLVAALFPVEVIRFHNDPHLYICSSQIEIFQLVLRYLRCSLSFVVSKQNYGGFKVDNHWTGILSLFEQEKADFIPHIFSLFFNRSELIFTDFVVPEQDKLTILSFPKLVLADSPLKLSACFDWRIWLLIGISFLVFGPIMAKNLPKRKRSTRDHHSTGLWTMYQLLIKYVDMFAILIGQAIVFQRGSTLNILRNSLFLWLFSTFLLRQLYSADIIAVLLSRAYTVIDSFEQLRSTTNLTILIVGNSTAQYTFVEKFPWLQSHVELVSHKDLTRPTMLARLIQSNSVMIGSRRWAEFILKTYQSRWSRVHHRAGFHISEEGHLAVASNYPIRKNASPQNKELLCKLFRWIHYFGISDLSYRTIMLNNLLDQHQQYPKLGVQQLLQTVVDQSRTIRSIVNDQGQKNEEDDGGGSDLLEPGNQKSQPIDLASAMLMLKIYLLGMTLASLCFGCEIVVRLFLLPSGATIHQQQSQPIIKVTSL